MSAHVLLNLLNELRKSDKMRVLSSILSFFRNEFFCSINHMTSKFHKNCISDVKIFCHIFRQRFNVRHYAKLLKSGYRLYCMTSFHSQTRITLSHDVVSVSDITSCNEIDRPLVDVML